MSAILSFVPVATSYTVTLDSPEHNPGFGYVLAVPSISSPTKTNTCPMSSGLDEHVSNSTVTNRSPVVIVVNRAPAGCFTTESSLAPSDHFRKALHDRAAPARAGRDEETEGCVTSR